MADEKKRRRKEETKPQEAASATFLLVLLALYKIDFGGEKLQQWWLGQDIEVKLVETDPHKL